MNCHKLVVLECISPILWAFEKILPEYILEQGKVYKTIGLYILNLWKLEIKEDEEKTGGG